MIVFFRRELPIILHFLPIFIHESFWFLLAYEQPPNQCTKIKNALRNNQSAVLLTCYRQNYIRFIIDMFFFSEYTSLQLKIRCKFSFAVMIVLKLIWNFIWFQWLFEKSLSFWILLKKCHKTWKYISKEKRN